MNFDDVSMENLVIYDVPTSQKYRRLGGESNREIDFGFGSCVRARALDVESEWAQNFRPPVSLFPFITVMSPFSLWEACESQSIQVKPSETK